MTGDERTMFRGRLVDLHAESIRLMTANLAGLPWWAWKRRLNIRAQLATLAIGMLRDQPYQVEIRAPAGR